MLGGGVGQRRDKKTEQAQTNPRDTYVPHTLPHPKGQASPLLPPLPTSCPVPRVASNSLCPKQVYIENRGPCQPGGDPAKTWADLQATTKFSFQEKGMFGRHTGCGF